MTQELGKLEPACMREGSTAMSRLDRTGFLFFFIILMVSIFILKHFLFVLILIFTVAQNHGGLILFFIFISLNVCSCGKLWRVR